MTGEYIFDLKPPEPTVFDHATYQWLMDEYTRVERAYGPRLTRISGCEPLIRWLMRQYPQADPAVTPVALLGSIALTIDAEVPLDSLRLAYADGSHKDVRVIGFAEGES